MCDLHFELARPQLPPQARVGVDKVHHYLVLTSLFVQNLCPVVLEAHCAARLDGRPICLVIHCTNELLPVPFLVVVLVPHFVPKGANDLVPRHEVFVWSPRAKQDRRSRRLV